MFPLALEVHNGNVGLSKETGPLDSAVHHYRPWRLVCKLSATGSQLATGLYNAANGTRCVCSAARRVIRLTFRDPPTCTWEGLASRLQRVMFHQRSGGLGEGVIMVLLVLLPERDCTRHDVSTCVQDGCQDGCQVYNRNTQCTRGMPSVQE